MPSKKPKLYEQVTFRVDKVALEALLKIEKALGPGVLGARSTAIRRALINEAARIGHAS